MAVSAPNYANGFQGVVSNHLPFCFEGGICLLIALVPVHCFLITFNQLLSILISAHWNFLYFEC